MIIPVNLKEYILALCYNKSDTYTQREIDSAIEYAIENIKLFNIVNTLPTTNIKDNKIYLVPNNLGLDDENMFDVFIHTSSDGWEQVDNIGFNINDYYTKFDVNNLLKGKSDVGHKHGSDEVIESQAYNNIGSGVNDSQKTINSKVNTVLGAKANKSDVYSKSETYTQSEINNCISTAVSNLELVEIVTTLPLSNIKNNKLYLVANKKNISNNNYDIYLRVGDKWEQLDSLEFKISDYATVDYVNTTIDNMNTNHSVELLSYAKTSYVDSELDKKADKNIASSTSDGLMSLGDKKKLDGISDGANKTIVDSALSNTSTNPVQNKIVYSNLNNKVDKVSGKGLSTNDYTTTEKNKLNGIEDGANKTIIDTQLSTTSTNPVQNKVVKSGLDTQSTNLTNHKDKVASNTEYGHVKYDTTPTKDSSYVLSSNTIYNSLEGKADKSHNHDTSYLKLTGGTVNGDITANNFKKKNGTSSQFLKADGSSDSNSYSVVGHTHEKKDITDFNHNHGNITNTGAIGTTANKPIITTSNGVLSTGNFEDVASNIKPNGENASAGSSNNFCRSDHVHPSESFSIGNAKIYKNPNISVGSDSGQLGPHLSGSYAPYVIGNLIYLIFTGTCTGLTGNASNKVGRINKDYAPMDYITVPANFQTGQNSRITIGGDGCIYIITDPSQTSVQLNTSVLYPYKF